MMLDRFGLWLYFLPWGRVFILGTVIVLFFSPVIGAFSLADAERSRDRYDGAPPCPASAITSVCRYAGPGTVVSHEIKRIASRYGTGESYHLRLEVAGDRSFDVQLHTQTAWRAIADGATATVEVWEGRVTSLHMAGQAIDLDDTPQDEVDQARGFLAISGGLSGIMLILSLPAMAHYHLTRARKSARSARPHRGHQGGKLRSRRRR